MTQKSREQLKGYTDSMILSLLVKEDLYAYEIAKRVRELFSGEFEFKEGTLYPALKRMEEQGLVEGYWGKSGTAGRRKYYKITANGQTSLEGAKAQWSKMKNVIESFLGGTIRGTN